MAATPPERLEYDDKASLKIGPIETYFGATTADVSHPADTVEQKPLDSGVDSVINRLAVGARTLSLSGQGFLDECVRLDALYQEDEPIEVRHWIFLSPQAIVSDFNYSSEKGLGSDGSGRHLARTSFDIELIETSG